MNNQQQSLTVSDFLSTSTFSFSSYIRSRLWDYFLEVLRLLET